MIIYTVSTNATDDIFNTNGDVDVFDANVDYYVYNKDYEDGEYKTNNFVYNVYNVIIDDDVYDI